MKLVSVYRSKGRLSILASPGSDAEALLEPYRQTLERIARIAWLDFWIFEEPHQLVTRRPFVTWAELPDLQEMTTEQLTKLIRSRTLAGALRPRH